MPPVPTSVHVFELGYAVKTCGPVGAESGDRTVSTVFYELGCAAPLARGTPWRGTISDLARCTTLRRHVEPSSGPRVTSDTVQTVRRSRVRTRNDVTVKTVSAQPTRLQHRFNLATLQTIRLCHDMSRRSDWRFDVEVPVPHLAMACSLPLSGG